MLILATPQISLWSNPLFLAIGSAILGAVLTVLLPALLGPFGLIRPIVLTQAKYTATDSGLALNLVVKNRRFRVPVELTSVLLLETPRGWVRLRGTMRYWWYWAKHLPAAPACYLLQGTDMGKIRNHEFSISGRGRQTIRADIVDARGKVLPKDVVLSDRIRAIAYASDKAPDLRRLRKIAS